MIDSSIRDAARRYAEVGLSVIPTGKDKLPAFELLPIGPEGKGWWTPFQSAIADAETIRRFFANGANVAIVTGAVSGGLLAIDFDNPRFYEAWRAAVGMLADGLVVQKTGKGYHVLFRCPDPGRAEKLAWVADDSEESGRRAAIETKAEGGYILAAPSLHGETGNRYEVLVGDLTAIPTLSQAHADALLSVARKLDEYPLTRQQSEARAKREAQAKDRLHPKDGESVIDAYNRATPIESVLTAHGYKVKGPRAIRPGGENLSITIRDGKSFHHNSNDPLSDGYWHSAFDIVCKLDHAGDVKAAVKAAADSVGLKAERPAPVNGGQGQTLTDESDSDVEPAQDTKTSTPTDDELRDRFLVRQPLTAYGLGEFRRYAGGIWESIPPDTIRKEVMSVLEQAKPEKVRPNASRLASVSELVRVKISVPDNAWDSISESLVCQNGTLNITTRELGEHSPSHYATSGVTYAYDPCADAPMWGYLLRTNVPDASGFLQEYAGYCLTTETSLETAVWLYGPRGSGRSTVIVGLQAMLGKRAGLLGLADIERSRFALANLPGKTLAVSTEQPTLYMTSTHILNAIISGETVTVERKYLDAVTITPHAKLIWAMNELPRVGDASNGLFRRVKVVKFPPLATAPDPEVKRVIATEGAGILNWALDGLERLRARGRFEIPSCVEDATAQFQKTNDVPAEFVSERCLTGPDYKVQSGDLYAAYRDWAIATGHKPQSSTSLAGEWERLGFERYRAAGKTFWRGVGVLA